MMSTAPHYNQCILNGPTEGPNVIFFDEDVCVCVCVWERKRDLGTNRERGAGQKFVILHCQKHVHVVLVNS